MASYLQRMYKTITATVLFAASAVAQSSSPQAQTEEERRFMEMISRGVVYRVPGMDRVELRNDVAYKKAGDQALFADVYIPRPRTMAAHPVVILIHGGVGEVPVKPKEWGAYRSWGELLAASGMVAVAFNHRLGFPEPRFDEAASDLADMIALIREQAEYFQADPNRICLAAFSAGGPLLSAAMRDHPAHIRCLVSYYNFLDLQQHERLREFVTEEKMREYSPIVHLNPRMPPMFIARAGKDDIPDLLPSIDRFISAAIAADAPITVANHPGAPHGFDTRTPNARSREIIRGSIDFMRWHLGIAPGPRPVTKKN